MKKGHDQRIQCPPIQSNLTLRQRSTNQNVIHCNWVFNVKNMSDGTLDKYKTHIIVKGFEQKDVIDYAKTFDLVVKLAIIRVIITLDIKL